MDPEKDRSANDKDIGKLKFSDVFVGLIAPKNVNFKSVPDKLRSVPKTFGIILIISIMLVLVAVYFYFQSKPGKEFVKRTSTDSNNVNSNINWTSYSQSVKKGIVESAGQILEVDMKSNVSEGNKLSILSFKRKNGHAPSDQFNERDFRLEFVSGENVIFQYHFGIPRPLDSAPPLNEEAVGEDVIGPEEINFTITTPWFDEADEIKIIDKSGSLVFSKKVSEVAVVENTPEFNSIDGGEIKKVLGRSTFHRKIMDLLTPSIRAQTSNKVDLVFIGHGFVTDSDIEKFHSDINRMLNHLVTYEPFATRISQFAFHYVDNREDLGCYYSGRFIFCNHSKVKNIINNAGVPYEDIMIIINSDTYGGTAWDDIAHTYNGDPYSEEVFVHEYGHSLARLEDEYISNQPHNRKDRNCYVGHPPNPDWEGYVKGDSYYIGCNTYEWYRSSSDSIMRSVRATYFNEISKYWLNYTIDQYAGKYASDTPTPTLTPTLKPGETPVPTATYTPTPTLAPGETPIPTATPTPTPTLAPGETPIPTPTSTPTPVPTATNTPTPTPTTGSCNSAPVFYFRDRNPYPSDEFHIWAGTDIWYESITVKIFNPNPSTCEAWNPPLSFSWAVPLDWTLEPAYNSISLKGQKTGEWPATLRVPQNALPGNYNIQFWLASYGPLNGTVEVHAGVCQFWNPPYNYCTSP